MAAFSSDQPAETSGDLIVFRDSFLFYFAPEAREKLRAAGTALFHQVLSGDQPRREEPWSHARLRDAVRDLRFVVQLLGEMAQEPFDSIPANDDENRLAQEALAWAEDVERVAARIEAEVDASPGWEDGEDG